MNQKMSTQRIPQLKRELHQMQDTNEQSDNMIKNPEMVEENFQKMREKLHWKITLNTQIEFIGQYILYELLQTHKHYDLYRGMKMQNRERVIVKIIDKSAIKLALIENQFLSNWQQQYEEFIEKVHIEHQASVALVNRTTSIFMVKSDELYGNSDCLIKVTENYYDEPLSKILQRRGSLTIEQALAVIKQIIYVLSQLHKQNIILTELNPQFIVYKNGVFKISDFSSMRKVGHGFASTLNLHNGYTYEDLIAPELKVCPEIIDIKSQIWAIGVLFYHMIAHSLPYEERGLNVIKKARTHNITVPTRSGPAPQEIVDFLRNLLEINPDQRITWNKLVKHPLFEKKQYFNTLKMLPIVDVRPQTIKKRENSMIQEDDFCNGFIDSLAKKNKPTIEIKQLNGKVLFKLVRQDKRIDIKKCLDIESQTFYYIQQTNLLALKSVYIYQEVLTKIKQYHLIDKKRRSHTETVFLIAQRCYQNMRRAKDYEGKASDRRVDNYLEQIKKSFDEIKAFFIQARQEYEHVDKSPYYISNDIFSMLKNNSKQKERQKMLRGREGLDFTIQQNVRFTQQKCINKILPEMKGSGSKKQQYNVLQSVKINLINYEKINSISLNDLKTQHCFSDVVAKVITSKKHSL